MFQSRRPRNRLRESLVMGGDTLDLDLLSSDLLSPTLLGSPAATPGPGIAYEPAEGFASAFTTTKAPTCGNWPAEAADNRWPVEAQVSPVKASTSCTFAEEPAADDGPGVGQAPVCSSCICVSTVWRALAWLNDTVRPCAGGRIVPHHPAGTAAHAQKGARLRPAPRQCCHVQHLCLQRSRSVQLVRG